MLDMTQVYIVALQVALRALPDKQVTFTAPVGGPRPWPDDGLDLMIRGDGDGNLTAMLIGHDEAVRLQAEYTAKADMVTRDRQTGATLAMRQLEPHAHQGGLQQHCQADDCGLPADHPVHNVRTQRRSLVERFRSARGG